MLDSRSACPSIGPADRERRGNGGTRKGKEKEKKTDVLVPWVCGRWRRCDAAAWRMPVRPRRLRCSRRATSCPRAVRPRRCPRARRTRYGQTCWGGMCTLGFVEVSSRAERAGGVWRDAVEDAARYGRCPNMFRRRAVVNDGTFSPTVSTTTTKTRTMVTATATTAATMVTVTKRLWSRLPLRLRQRRRQRRRRRWRRRWRRWWRAARRYQPRERPEERIYRAASENQTVTAMAAACSSGALLPDFWQHCVRLVCAGCGGRESERGARGKETEREGERAKEREHKGNRRERRARTMTAGSLVHSLAHTLAWPREILGWSDGTRTDPTYELTDRSTDRQHCDEYAREKAEKGRKDETSENCVHAARKERGSGRKGDRSYARKGWGNGRNKRASERERERERGRERERTYRKFVRLETSPPTGFAINGEISMNVYLAFASRWSSFRDQPSLSFSLSLSFAICVFFPLFLSPVLMLHSRYSPSHGSPAFFLTRSFR